MCGEKKSDPFGLRGLTLPSMGINGMTIFRKVMWEGLLDYARLEW